MDRFWSKAEKQTTVTSPHVDTPCWVWTAYIGNNGYGQFSLDGRMQSAHRVSWEWTNGSIPDGLGVRHKCDNPPCVRPDHLWLGTDAEDAADRVAKGRQSKGEKHSKASAKGEKHCKAKLTEAIVREIRASEESNAALARKYGVSDVAIRDIRKGWTWKHLK